MKLAFLRSFFLTLVFFWASSTFGQSSIPEKPSVIYPIYDKVGLLTQDQQSEINNQLIQFQKESSTEILVVIIPSTQGEDINFYATQWGQKWGIGRKKVDNGVVFMIATNDHSLAIQQGRAVEQYLTASDAGQILDHYVTPEFKRGDYHKGIKQGVTKIIESLNGQFKAQPKKNKQDQFPSSLFVIAILIILFIIIYSNRNKGGNSGGNLFDDDVVISRRGSNFGGMWFPNSGGSFGGGSGGGGFGGFGGGGSFGGGGASGGW